MHNDQNVWMTPGRGAEAKAWCLSKHEGASLSLHLSLWLDDTGENVHDAWMTLGRETLPRLYGGSRRHDPRVWMTPGLTGGGGGDGGGGDGGGGGLGGGEGGGGLAPRGGRI